MPFWASANKVVKERYLKLPTSNSMTRLILLCVLSSVSSALFAQNLYRYTNHENVQVIDDHIPPEFVAKGYDIIRRDGTLIKRIPRQLSEEELRLQNTEEARERLRQEEEQKLRAWDESLLLRYSSVEDIEAAKKRALSELNIRISILKSNLLSVKTQIENQQRKAADIERRGSEAPQALLDNIKTFKIEIEDIEEAIQQRQKEIQTVEDSYQRDIARFSTLLSRIKMRR